MSGQESATTSQALQNFVLLHSSHNRPIVLVTSGGTQTPLEKNPVRFIDNFSTGYRGSISIEHFLKKGYAVLHLWRKGSASPFTHALNNKLGLDVNETFNISCLDILLDLSRGEHEHEHGQHGQHDHNNTIKDDNEEIDYPRLHPRLVYDTEIRSMIRERNRVNDNGLLHTIPYVTLDEYLDQLQHCCEMLSSYGPMVIMYLAAAVSDYWIPPEERSMHKIQSGGELQLTLKPVPKKIGLIRSAWAPDAFVVSFKLETDESILDKKAYNAIKKYGSHCVVANLLHTRHDVVYVITPTDNIDDNDNEYSKLEIRNNITRNNKTMEEHLVETIIEKHLEYASNNKPYVFTSFDKMDYKRKQIKNAILWNKVKDWTLEIIGTGVGMFISYYVSGFIRRRLER